METSVPPKSAPADLTVGDIVFSCVHCSTPLIVNRAAAGLTLSCQRCGRPTTVPISTENPESNAQTHELLAHLQRRLQENESQRTETTSYVNQLGIQLHRYQLRLERLNERQAQLQTEIAGLLCRHPNLSGSSPP
jgi:hypothetical protein